MHSGNSDFTLTPLPTSPSLPHFPRDVQSRGLRHSTVIIIAASASVGGLLLVIILWRFLSHLFRPKSAPLPPRQAPVHQRELQLVAFTEHKNASVPQILTDDSFSGHIHYGSDSALLPSNVGDLPPSTSNPVSSYETDETTLDSSYGNRLHPPSPHFFPPRIPHTPSSSSLPSSGDDSAPSSDAATPPTPLSTSVSASPSFRRARNRSGHQPRPMSSASISTLHTARSRQSVRAAPHAPHSNVQIVLPAPLAPNLYDSERITSDRPRVQSMFGRESTYSDSWRTSLVDTWISVGQHGLPDPEPMERQYGHDSTERPTRLIRRGSSPGPRSPRSRSNPSPLSRHRPSSGLDQVPQGTHPPVPRVPSEYGALSGHRALAPSAPSGQGALMSRAPSSTDSHNP
jgi:hypothetical protein